MLEMPDLSSIRKPLVMLEATGLGLIVLWPSGVVYTNQTGGVYCTKPSAEGVYLPLGTEAQEAALEPLFGTASSRMSAEEADVVDAILASDWDTKFLKVDRTRLEDSHEAWVFVTIGAHPSGYPSLPLVGSPESWADPESSINQSCFPIFGFGAAHGILTWPNSD